MATILSRPQWFLASSGDQTNAKNENNGIEADDICFFEIDWLRINMINLLSRLWEIHYVSQVKTPTPPYFKASHLSVDQDDIDTY